MMKHYKPILLSILLLTSSSSLSTSVYRELPPSFEIQSFGFDLLGDGMYISENYHLIEKSLGVLSEGDYSSKLKQEEINISKFLRSKIDLLRLKIDSLQKSSATYPISLLLRERFMLLVEMEVSINEPILFREYLVKLINNSDQIYNKLQVNEWSFCEPFTIGKYNKYGEKDGEWTTSKSCYTISYGNYKKGDREGKWIFYNPSKDIRQIGFYKNGKRHGDWHYNSLTWSESGKYINGQREGKWVLSYVPDGGTVKTYKNGQVISQTDFDFRYPLN